MANQQEQALEVLKRADTNDIHITRFPDGSVLIKIIPHKTAKELPPKLGKWAQIAEELAQENLLRDGLGNELRKNSSQFRESLTMRMPFTE